MCDTILAIGKSQLQHGPANDRVYVMKLDPAATDTMLDRIAKLTAEKGYSKIFAKVPAPARGAFLKRGYVEEAHIPGYYDGCTDLHFMSRFLTRERASDADEEKHKSLLLLARQKALGTTCTQTKLPASFHYRTCSEQDVEEIVRLYCQVFESYPFPIHDPDYIAETMHTNVTYFGIWKDRRLVALSSAERDLAAGSVEMTDFATLPSARRRGLSVFLLQRMEEKMVRCGVYTAYTIARAASAGMNIVFAKQKYQYGGTLVNNTNICGQLESMNIWWKNLSAEAESTVSGHE